MTEQLFTDGYQTTVRITKNDLVDLIADHYHGHSRHQAEGLATKVVEFVRGWMADHIDPWDFEYPGTDGTESEHWEKEMA